MRFISTRDNSKIVDFSQAFLDCMPADGGLYVPYQCEDLRNWILYADENTTFASIAGALTSALINKEYSPIICEAIAMRAYRKLSPSVRQLDDGLFLLELCNGPTGSHKDFGTAYLVSALETIAQLEEKKAVLLDVTTGQLGACMSGAIRNKKFVKSVLVTPKGSLRGIREEDLVWNGGNIYPIEVDGTEEDCHNLVRKVFARRDFVLENGITLANSTNIGRLLPQSFFYTYAFTRIKKQVTGGIYYALPVGNYGNLVSGLYAWQMALPMNGFIIPCTKKIGLDEFDNVAIPKSELTDKSKPSDPSEPSNFERLEYLFKENELMMRSFVYPAHVSDSDRKAACRELYTKYGIFADSDTSAAYAASLKRRDVADDEGSIVLFAREAPELERDFIFECTGAVPSAGENVASAFKTIVMDRQVISKDDVDFVMKVVESL